ncbi:hypothetical protein SLE2022_262210 [Rubroshorea leprosula]
MCPRMSTLLLLQSRPRRPFCLLIGVQTGFKCVINYKPTTDVPGGDLAEVQKAVCTISHSTSVAEVFSYFDKVCTCCNFNLEVAPLF